MRLVVSGSRPEVGRLAQALGVALNAMLPNQALGPAYLVEVESRRHLVRLVAYLLKLPEEPTRWDGSCLPDLLGARRLPGFEPALWTALPRLGPRDLASTVDLPARYLQRATLDSASPKALVEAAAAAIGRPSLAGREREVAAARRVVTALARQAGWPTALVAQALRVGPASARRLAGGPVDSTLAEAVLRQITLRSAPVRS